MYLYRFLINSFHAKIHGSDSFFIYLFIYFFTQSSDRYCTNTTFLTQILWVLVCPLYDSFPKIIWGKKAAIQSLADNISMYHTLIYHIVIFVSWQPMYHIAIHTCQYTALINTMHMFSSLWTRNFQHPIWPGGSLARFTSADITNNPCHRYL